LTRAHPSAPLLRVIAFALAGLLWLGGCAGQPMALSCTDGATTLITGYAGSANSPCTRLSSTAFALEIQPEAEPINPSPWYAFTLAAPEGREAQVTLNYAASQHRYPPWVRATGADWVQLDEDQITLNEDGRQAQIHMRLSAPAYEIAAQPAYLIEDYQALEMRWAGAWRSIGSSVEGRPIRALVLPPEEGSTDWALILGRQHPPEVPGAWALEAFVDEALAQREAGGLTEGLIIVPMLNPDGVEAGHWRLNRNHIDLNRDWAARSQPEVQAVYALLDALGISVGQLALMVDFHSTVADRIYLPQPEELPAVANQRLEAWLNAMDADRLFAHLEPRRTNPRRRVSAKAVFTDEWGAVSVTWEAGDETAQVQVRENARRAAALWAATRSRRD